jgi:KRAB domain-containing zinc finger protein
MFTLQTNLRRHESEVHSTNLITNLNFVPSLHHLKHTCEMCDLVFDRKDNLKIHTKSVHRSEDEAKYNCNTCEPSFKRKYHLMRHKQEQHMNMVKIKCDFCGKLYGRESDLKIHVKKLHELRCASCEKPFTNKSELKKHCQEHEDLSQKKFKCKDCEKLFGRKFDLKRHRKGVHGFNEDEED